MSTVTLKAHFDGQVILLDEPYQLPRDAKLLVMVLSSDASDAERADWLELSAQGLNGAYGDDEPDYSSAEFVS
ncbi:MAG: hypothetical protein WD669_03655 [Pirellulales bacterium]